MAMPEGTGTPEKRSFLRSIVFNVKGKSLALFLMLVSCFLFFYITLSSFNSTDPIPEFSIIDEAKQKEFGAFTVKIKNGLFIRNFPSFDMIKNNFVVDAIVWFEFPPDEIMLDTIGLFSFENGRIVQKSPPDIKLGEKGTFVKYEVRIEFKANLTYYKFPFEDHRVTLILANNFVTPSEMFFLIDNNSFAAAPNLFISNWILKDLSTDTGYQSSILDAKDAKKQALYPLVSFTMKFQKASIRKVLIIFIPLFFALLLSLFSFLLTISNGIGRTTFAVSGLSALLGYRFVIESMMPDVGYFTTTDIIYIMFLSIAIMIFVFQTMLSRYTTLEGVGDHGFKQESPQHTPDAFFHVECVNTGVFFTILMTVVIGIAILVLR